MVLPSTLFVSGGSLVGSNYLFKRMRWIDIPSKVDERWNEKLNELLKKIEKDFHLARKIDKTLNARRLAKNGNDFTNRDEAKEALQEWCAKKDKTEAKEHSRSLCHVQEQKGWLF